MSINQCHNCGDIYDTDEQMELDEKGNMICDSCFDDILEEREHNFTKHKED